MTPLDNPAPPQSSPARACQTQTRFRRPGRSLALWLTRAGVSLAWAWAGIVMTAAPAGAVPRIASVSPLGAQRGTEVEVTLTGTHLNDLEELIFFRPGIEVVKIENDAFDKARVILKIAADCPPGLYDFRPRSRRGGLGALQSFSVGALNEIKEIEPNNDFAAPQEIPLGSTVNGVAGNEDVDYYAVRLTKGQRLTAEVEGIRLGITLFDPYVAILNSERFELATSDDDAQVRQDGIATIVAPEDGTYIVEVRESAYQGNGACFYRLHVGEYPRARAVFPAGGKAGSTVQLRWIGDPAGERTTTVTLPSDPEAIARFTLFDQDERGISPAPYVFRVSDLEDVNEDNAWADPNGPQPIPAPGAVNGVIDQPGDSDSFRFTAKKGQVFEIRAHARSIRSPLDPVLNVARLGGGVLAGNDDIAAGNPDCFIAFTAPEDADYVVTLYDHLGQGGPEFVYRIELTTPLPKVTLTPQAEQLRRGTPIGAASVPQGNRQAILVSAGRANYGQVLHLLAHDLPPGVVLKAPPFPTNLNLMPVIFEAAPDAAIGASLIQLDLGPDPTAASAQPPPPKPVVEFSHTSTLVYGQNNISFWDRVTDRYAVGVIQAVPFSIAAVEPQAPLVRNGSLELRVQARREPGFDGEITLNLPWNPPGVSSARNVKIPKDRSEATITLNANGNAPTQTWPIVVEATASLPNPSAPPNARTPNIDVRIASDFINLTIGTPHLSLASKPAGGEQGKEIFVAAELSKIRDFEGEALIELLGLPHQVSCEPVKVKADTTEVTFKLTTTTASPVGQHKGILARFTIQEHGEPVVFNVGLAPVRIDKPAPAPVQTAPAPTPQPQAQPAQPQTKPLSRLEQLRLEYQAHQAARAEKAKADPQGQPPPSP